MAFITSAHILLDKASHMAILNHGHLNLKKQGKVSCLLAAKGIQTLVNNGNNMFLAHMVANVRNNTCRMPVPYLAHNKCSMNGYDYLLPLLNSWCYSSVGSFPGSNI